MRLFVGHNEHFGNTNVMKLGIGIENCKSFFGSCTATALFVYVDDVLKYIKT